MSLKLCVITPSVRHTSPSTTVIISILITMLAALGGAPAEMHRIPLMFQSLRNGHREIHVTEWRGDAN